MILRERGEGRDCLSALCIWKVKSAIFLPTVIRECCLLADNDSACTDCPVFTTVDPGGEKGGGETVQGGPCI